MKIKFKDIASIQTGIYAKPGISSEIIYLQARHFNPELVFDKTVPPDLPLNSKIEKHLLKNGNIIVAAKGFSHFAVLYNSSFGRTVASSMFLVIKDIKSGLVLPEYLAWFLNHPNTQTYLKNNARGTGLPSISKTILENLDILLPSIERQKTILKIHELHLQENELKMKIQGLHNKIINHYLISSIE